MTTATTDVLADLADEQERLDDLLVSLPEADWLAPSAAAGWTVADVVLHLAQTDEAVAAGVGLSGSGVGSGSDDDAGLDECMDRLVRAERAAPAVVYARWRAARQAALATLRDADPDRPRPWVTTPLKPRTLATTRIAEYWTHGLDITDPLRIAFPDSERLRHVAWLAHATLPFAFALAGESARPVRCELSAPDGATVWRFGPPDADSAITGAAGQFCRVAAQRLAPSESGLGASGPHAESALKVLRTYAV